MAEAGKRRTSRRASSIPTLSSVPSSSPLCFQRSRSLQSTVSKLKGADVNLDPIVLLTGPQSAGKSMLAMMSVQTDDAIQLFPHGVTWLNFGELWRQEFTRKKRQEKLLRILLREVQIICEVVPSDVRVETNSMYNAEECKALIRMLVHHHSLRLLLVLDDVDSVEDVAEFAYLGMIVLVTSKFKFPQHDQKTIDIDPFLTDADLMDLKTDYGVVLGSNSSRPILELKLMLTMPGGLINNSNGSGSGDLDGQQLVRNFISSLNNVEEKCLLSLGYLDKNIPVSFELLAHFWNMEVSQVTEMSGSLLTMGCGHTGHGARTFFIHEELYEIVYMLLHEKENFYFKIDVETSLRRYLVSPSSFRDSIFESCEMQQMLYFWENSHYNLNFESEFLTLVDRKVDEALQIEVRSANNINEIFETAENMCILMKCVLNGAYKQTAAEKLNELYNHKHNLLGDHHDVVEAFGKLYTHFILDSTYLSDDQPRKATLLIAYTKMMLAAYGDMDMSIYPMIKSVAVDLNDHGFEEDSQKLFESVTSSALFNGHKYSAPCVLFVEAFFESLKDRGRHRDITKYALQMAEECPTGGEYDIVRSRLLNCLATVYEARGKFNKARAIRESMASSCVISYGGKHPLTCEAIESLVALIERQGKAPELIEPLLVQFYESWKSIHGATRMVELRTVVLKICDKKESRGEMGQAIELLKATLNDIRANTGVDATFNYGDILPLLEKLGALYLGEGMQNDAINIFKRVVMIVENYMGNDGDKIPSEACQSMAKAQFYIGSSYYSVGKVNKALKCYAESIQLFESVKDQLDDSIVGELGKTHMCYGEALYKKGGVENLRKAAKSLSTSLHLLRRNHLDDDPLLLEISKLKQKVEKDLDVDNGEVEKEHKVLVQGDISGIYEPEKLPDLKANEPLAEIERMDERKIEKTLNILDGLDTFEIDESLTHEDIGEDGEIDMYCNTFKYDYFYFSSKAKRSYNEDKDQATSLDEILKNDLVPIFVYGEHRQGFSKHYVLQSIEEISFVYTSSTVDLFAMVVTKTCAREGCCRVAIKKYKRNEIDMSNYHRPICQIIGEVYLIPRVGLNALDESFGEDYTMTNVRVRHSAGHFITAITYDATKLNAFDEETCLRLPQGDFERYVDMIGSEEKLFVEHIPRCRPRQYVEI